MATPKQGKDLEIACKMINEGAHMRDVALANPAVYIMFHKGLEKYKAILRNVWRPAGAYFSHSGPAEAYFCNSGALKR